MVTTTREECGLIDYYLITTRMKGTIKMGFMGARVAIEGRTGFGYQENHGMRMAWYDSILIKFNSSSYIIHLFSFFLYLDRPSVYFTLCFIQESGIWSHQVRRQHKIRLPNLLVYHFRRYLETLFNPHRIQSSSLLGVFHCCFIGWKLNSNHFLRIPLFHQLVIFQYFHRHYIIDYSLSYFDIVD